MSTSLSEGCDSRVSCDTPGRPWPGVLPKPDGSAVKVPVMTTGRPIREEVTIISYPVRFQRGMLHHGEFKTIQMCLAPCVLVIENGGGSAWIDCVFSE